MGHFRHLEAVGRGSETQLQGGEILNYLMQRFKGSHYGAIHEDIQT